MSKILHIIHDDKFPIMAQRSFESAFPGLNEFVIFSNRRRWTEEMLVTRYPRIYALLPRSIRKIVGDRIVVFHSMSDDNLLILKALPKNTKVVWLGWGYDYYDLIGIPLLKPKTQQLNTHLAGTGSASRHIKNLMKKIVYFGLNKNEAIEKVDIFAPVIEEDYKLSKASSPHLRAQYADWNYGTLEDDIIRGFENARVNGQNILLGNSASYTSNHLDAFDDIERLDLKSRNIIIPLSYGDHKYRDAVIRIGKERFGSQFQPLIDFMPIDDYIQILQSCSVVVMNHRRQQAVGNIIIALHMGAKVFLDGNSPVFAFFKKHGVAIFAIEDIRKEYQSPLSEAQIAHTHKMLKDRWGREAILNKTKALIRLASTCK